MEKREVKLRCIEAAARAPVVHKDGPAAGVLEVARQWAAWVEADVEREVSTAGTVPKNPLGLPKK